jgi:hypothetical protein
VSCQLCHYITGHDPECRHAHEDRQREQDDLRTRIDGLETRLDQLEKLVRNYAHLNKLYGVSIRATANSSEVRLCTDPVQ